MGVGRISPSSWMDDIDCIIDDPTIDLSDVDAPSDDRERDPCVARWCELTPTVDAAREILFVGEANGEVPIRDSCCFEDEDEDEPRRRIVSPPRPSPSPPWLTRRCCLRRITTRDASTTTSSAAATPTTAPINTPVLELPVLELADVTLLPFPPFPPTHEEESAVGATPTATTSPTTTDASSTTASSTTTGTTPQQNTIAHSSAPRAGGGRPLKLVKKLIAFIHVSYPIKPPPFASHGTPFTFKSCTPSLVSGANPSPRRPTATTPDEISVCCPRRYEVLVFNLVGTPNVPFPLVTITALLTYARSSDARSPAKR